MPVEQSIAAALPLIDRALKLDPQLAETHASLGFLRMFERDLTASEAALQRAIELSPSMSRAYLWLYVVYDQWNKPGKAFEVLQRTFALDPLSPIVNTNMAAEWWVRGNNAEALKAAQRVIQINPDGPLGYRRSGRILRTSGKLAEAFEWYRRALEVAPDDPNSKLELGTLQVDLGNYMEAENMLGDHRYLADLAQGRHDDALAVVHSTLAQRPGNLNTIVAAARAESWAGNFDRMRALLEPLLDDPEFGKDALFRQSGVHFWDPQVAALDLSMAWLESGEDEKGLQLLARARKHFDYLRDEGLDHPMLQY